MCETLSAGLCVFHEFLLIPSNIGSLTVSEVLFFFVCFILKDKNLSSIMPLCYLAMESAQAGLIWNH